jgi:hypothetical protein
MNSLKMRKFEHFLEGDSTYNNIIHVQLLCIYRTLIKLEFAISECVLFLTLCMVEQEMLPG